MYRSHCCGSHALGNCSCVALPPALLDFDPQGSSIRWLNLRPQSTPAIYGVHVASRKNNIGVTRSFQMRVPPETECMIIDAPAGVTGNELRDLIGSVTPIPKMPDFVCGAINLRGHIVPVIDLLERLGSEKSVIGKRSCIVIVEMQFANETLSIGVTVDAVSKVMDFKKSDIEQAPSFGGAIETDFIEGMGKLGDEFVVILNIDRVLSLDDLALIADVHKDKKKSA